MNWALIGGIAAALLINEIGEISPWLARTILRLAARLEAGRGAEEALIFEELRVIMDGDIPGKLTKLVWAIGRLGVSVHFGARRLLPARSIEGFLRRFMAGTKAVVISVGIGLIFRLDGAIGLAGRVIAIAATMYVFSPVLILVHGS